MLTDRFDDALSLAARLHRTQTRKGSGIPYISHLMAVSALVIENGGDEDQAIAGLLHDAVEDQGGQETADMIRATYGDRVADIVLACSDAVDQSRIAWRDRKNRYLASLATKGEDALLVTSCDKLHNATAILTDLRAHGPAVFDRFTARRDGTLWYYRQLADTLTRVRPGPLSDRLAATVAALETAA
ncbi:HD domain-containing protein [Maritimibacter sp. UBA3975]|uniref:HD domain-containing protein n=1 Tax=Maritimibacter sp. UBA3975 TaxID=1946833 RepID=UPI000C09038F|nr:HD domain-containing protein [Maritimibacter sp. UBA3975]MAM61731.1 phosphohydrolase [Maritimibacter sp.]|tara:strand:+ start:2398 stop:2958 length:561 start_codon:yes stop_codon:yes gene_type:complete